MLGWKSAHRRRGRPARKYNLKSFRRGAKLSAGGKRSIFALLVIVMIVCLLDPKLRIVNMDALTNLLNYTHVWPSDSKPTGAVPLIISRGGRKTFGD